MIEIKFLKDLPIKLANNNKSILQVLGGDIYYDSVGNRYGYISFKNPNKSPIFALQLAVKEYSVDGKFIKDNELFEGYTYYPTGDFVINQPILLDKETEAVEITIVKITFRKANFINDRFVAFKKEDYVELYQSKAPVKRSSGASSNFFAGLAKPASNEELTPLGEEAPESPVQESAPSEASAEAPVVEEPVKEEKVPETPVSELRRFAKEKKTIFTIIPFAAAALLLVVFLFIIMMSVTGGVNAFNYYNS